MENPNRKEMPPLIALEEHFFSTAVLESLDASYSEQFKHIPGLAEKVRDLDSIRLASMDSNKISMQVISHGPGSLTLAQCKSANDQLSAAVKHHPTRFAGFAVLPVSDPDNCAAELRRCIEELKFVGALIDNHTPEGRFYDAEAYRPLFGAAQDLDVPIYLHPTFPSDATTSALYEGTQLPPAAVRSISTSGFGWHSAVAVHVLRLFAAGVFDAFPRLKIIIGHMGEMLPFMLQRIIQLSPRWGPRQRPFRQVYDENLYITTSGVWSVDPLATIIRNTRPDRILFSVDYPFAKNEDGLEFMYRLRDSGLVDEEMLERIGCRNAAALLGLENMLEKR